MDEVFRLRDYLYEATGMYFPDSKRYFFETRFAKRLQALKLNSYRDYLQYLLTSPGRKEEFLALIQEITINETSFFRNMPQIKALADLVLPEIMKIKENGRFFSLRIWSAGCSSGEEAYTIAMMIRDRYPEIEKKWRVEILGTDLNPKMIEQAKKGVYCEYTMRNVPPSFRNRYFRRLDKGFEIDEKIKKSVQFKVSNLIDDMEMVFLKKFDVIFCRNVLIYFDSKSKKKVIEHFYNNLLDTGYLFLGHSESLYGVTDRFKLVHFPGGMAYKKVLE